MPKLKMWVEVSGRINGYEEELTDLPADWDQRDPQDQREYAMQCWEEFRDSIANGGFIQIDDDGAQVEL